MTTGAGRGARPRRMLGASSTVTTIDADFIEKSGLNSIADVIKPGCSFHELLRHRQETGTFADDVDEYIEDILRKRGL